MTPEEAKPHTDFDIEITYRSGKKQTKTVLSPTPFFTAKEAAEIARAYATAFYKDQRCEETGVKGMGENAPKWRKLFKEWSK